MTVDTLLALLALLALLVGAQWDPTMMLLKFQQLRVTIQRKPHQWYSSFFQFIPVSAPLMYNYQGHSGCFHSISNSYWKFACSNITFTWDNFVSVAFGVIFWYWVQYLMSNQLENTGGLYKKRQHPVTATLESVNTVWLEMSLIKSYSQIVLKHTYPFHT